MSVCRLIEAKNIVFFFFFFFFFFFYGLAAGVP